MALGSSMLATIRTAPPQWAQVVMSMEKTRLLRPAHRTALLLGAARFVVGADVHRHCIARRPLAAPRWRQLRAQVCIRGEYAVEAGEMRARWRDQCRQLGDEVHRIPFDMRGPIAPRRLELVTHPTLR